MNMKPTPEQIRAYIQTVKAIADTIKELGQVPAGTLYAQLMSLMSLDAFERTIGQLTGAGLVRREPSHLLVWIGPK
jgi:hypothetical protein